MDGSAPEEEILSVLDVPPGKMGRVIGKRGASILSIKESCKYLSLHSVSEPSVCSISCLYWDLNVSPTYLLWMNQFYSAEILMGGDTGPPDKVSSL